MFDTASEKMAGVKVEVVDGPQAGTSVLSGPDGRFSLSVAPADTVTLRATKDGYVTANKTVPVPNCPGCPATTPTTFLTLVALENVRLQTGPYTMTWVTDSACTTIPENVRTLTYAATVTPDITDPGYQVDAGTAASRFGIGLAGNDLAIEIDEGLHFAVPPNGSVALFAYAVISVATSPVSIAFPVTGKIDYLGPETGFTHVTCQSSNHQLILTRQ